MSKDNDEYGQDESDNDSVSIQSEKPRKKRKYNFKNKTLSIKTNTANQDAMKDTNAEEKKDDGTKKLFNFKKQIKKFIDTI